MKKSDSELTEFRYAITRKREELSMKNLILD